MLLGARTELRVKSRRSEAPASWAGPGQRGGSADPGGGPSAVVPIRGAPLHLSGLELCGLGGLEDAAGRGQDGVLLASLLGGTACWRVEPPETGPIPHTSPPRGAPLHRLLKGCSWCEHPFPLPW